MSSYNQQEQEAMRGMKHTDTTKKNEVLCAFTIIGTKLRNAFSNQGHQRGGYLCVISGCVSFILGGLFHLLLQHLLFPWNTWVMILELTIYI